jgi:recombination protein RecA
MSEKSQRTTQLIIDKINKTYGEGSIMKITEEVNTDVVLIPVRFPSLNYALGGGLPEGRIIEVFGNESSGKSTLALHFAADVQAAGYEVGYVDAEHALDLSYAEKLGVDLERFYISQPGNGEEALEIVDLLLDSDLKLIVIDSVSALTPRAELEGSMGDSHVALQARLMSQAMRKLVGRLKNHKTIILFINQLRENVGIMWGNPEVTTGGKALKFYASLRIETRRSEKIMQGETITVGEKVKIKIVKNKIAPPFRLATLSLIYQQGFSVVADIVDEAIAKKLIKKKGGGYFSYDTPDGEINLAQGWSKLLEVVTDNEEFQEELIERLKNDK